MHIRTHIDFFGATLLVGLSVLLGLNQALVKLVNVGLAPVFQGGLRSACAFCVVVLWMLLRGKGVGFSRGTRLLGITNGTLFALEFAFLFLALDYGGVARVSLLFYSMPLFVACGAHFLLPNEKLTGLRIAGLLLALTGVALVLSERGAVTMESTLRSDIYAILAAMCWASLTLLTRGSRLATLSAEENLQYHLAVSAVVLLVMALFFGDILREPTAIIWSIFAFQVLVVASLGFMVWLWVLAHYPVSSMASYSLLTPLFGVFFGWFIFDENLSTTFISASLAVCGGLYMINRKPAAPSSTKT